MIIVMEKGPGGDHQLDPTVWDESSSLEVAEESTAQLGQVVAPAPRPPKQQKSIRSLFSKKNLLLFGIVVIVLGLLIAGILVVLKKPAPPPANSTYIINTQSLDNGTLNELTSQADGNIKQQLTISPETIFKSDVTVQGSVKINKDLTVNGSTNLQGPTTLNDSLTVARSLTVNGNTAFASNLSVNGQISAASLTVGSLTISSINLSNNLVFAGHLVPNGTAPAARVSVAASGGSVTINGNDTAGTVAITVGSGGLTPGEMAIITFKTAFNTTPKVQLTPINDSGSNLRYYATRSASFFTVNTSTAPTTGTTYVFDYFVTQ